jgi:cytochrome c oxidase accessory protein FixG
MVISRHITGIFRTRRYIVEGLLLALFFISPWINLPSGVPMIRLDIPGRKFHLFGEVYIPQEGIILMLFLLTMGLSLFFFTSLVGRVWCGWACPQTIYTDIFDFFGRLVLGKKYGKKDAPKWKVGVVHFLWILVSFVASFHWIAFFVSPYQMLEGFSKLQFAGEKYHYFIAFFTMAVYLDMGFVREQFCKYACPYARFQTILMDEHSYNVTYDYKRGEPRRNKTEKIGDCTACNMCLVVCPTGIDIREGLQVGCIACAKCVDACTVQMAKENKKSLIHYYSLNQIETGQKIKWIRPRVVVYGALLLLIVSLAIFKIATRVPLSMILIPDKSIEPTLMADGKLINYYKLKLQNISNYEQKLLIRALPPEGLSTNVLMGEVDSEIVLPPLSMKDLRVVFETTTITDDMKKKSPIQMDFVIQDKNEAKIRLEKKVPLSLPVVHW